MLVQPPQNYRISQNLEISKFQEVKFTNSQVTMERTLQVLYGYVTNSKVKFVMVVDSSNTALRDNEIRSMFRKLHNSYTDVMCNPFYNPGDRIQSSHQRRQTSHLNIRDASHRDSVCQHTLWTCFWGPCPRPLPSQHSCASSCWQMRGHCSDPGQAPPLAGLLWVLGHPASQVTVSIQCSLLTAPLPGTLQAWTQGDPARALRKLHGVRKQVLTAHCGRLPFWRLS
ncbi:trafficking protein particle complex subunit 2-like protein isoform X5 [Nycticebus coucang]|uniref:trafficking protein particle complex subunit 2-like protein isoform X5 n=1 Tax=Nycticebus coucang TaxID=9470 RepID=UPI00234C6370|nr:trafficking protein particle complex subunit 2-like protein isoform X5 [Nycticebus coucang]